MMTDTNDVSRRRFLQLAAASAALAGAGGCVSHPAEEILPYVDTPPELVPGVPLTYATTMTVDGYGTGVLAEAREGRPVKIEGNPDHPASLGASGIFEQASVLSLYEPTRARALRRGHDPVSWKTILETFGAPRSDRGAGLRFLLEPTASPLRRRLLDRVRLRHPDARVFFHSATASPSPVVAARRVFGRPLRPHLDLGACPVVVSFGADLLASGPFHLRHARDFGDGRREPLESMSRLFVAEALPTPTGSLADHRLPVRDAELPRLLAALVGELGLAAPTEPPGGDAGRAWIRAVAADLEAHRGAGLVAVGPGLPVEAHALACLANAALGNEGLTVRYAPPVLLEDGEEGSDLAALVEDLRSGIVDTLVVLEGNPVYASPAELGLGPLLREIPTTLYLAPEEDETAAGALFVVPAAHYLEAWGDARAYDGTVSTVQPLIEPLWDGRTPDEVLAVFAGTPAPPRTLVRQAWRDGAAVSPPPGEFEAFWKETIQRGLVEDTALPAVTVTADTSLAAELVASLPPREDGLEIAFRPDPRLHDGRFAQNAWLLELPEPTTKLTWENALLLSPATAERLGVASEDLVDVTLGGRRLRLPVLTVPGHADEALTVHLGWGRGMAEGPAAGAGSSAYRIQPAAAPFAARGAIVRSVRDLGTNGRPARRRLAVNQTHASMEGRPIVLESTLEAFRRDPGIAGAHRGPLASLYQPPRPRADQEMAAQQWAMTIDLGSCTGCSACVVACQAENNVPSVGREGVLNHRTMHWLRIDRYVVGDERHLHQPMLCQHCEKAPCEYVCPVNATVHSADGLNEMVYNRCVGTRFCSNNCPYKVRRFNWFDYNEARPDEETLALNPDVTVRERGVMEKCTYCVQRIRRTQIDARREGRPLRRDEVVTACQQACPTRAIVFGDLEDPQSAVSRSRRDARQYEVLHDLGTRPRTRYLVRLTNPSPALPIARPKSDGEGSA